MNYHIITIGMAISTIFAIITVLLYLLESYLYMITLSISVFGIIIINIGWSLNSAKRNKKEKKQC